MGLPRSNMVQPPFAARPLEVATTIPQIDNPFLAAPAASGSVDVMVEDAMSDTHSDAPAVDHAPSTHDLLERAARLGPPRPTLESIVLPNDPILLEKMTPMAAERRARFRKVVKATLGACLALCVAALVASALSPSEASAAESSASAAHAVPARSFTSVEKLDSATRGKAVTSRAATRATTAHAVVKKKSGKRR